MKTGVYGGTFDPIHFGHLLLAETARDFLALDRVVFVPAGIPPHKREKKITPGNDRAEMIRRAIAGNPAFELSRVEIDSNEVSYTARTLARFREEFPSDEFFLLVGSETLADIPDWFMPREVCRLSTPTVAKRPGAPDPNFARYQDLVPPERLAYFKRQIVPMPLVEISATDVRRRVALGQSVRYFVPESVRLFIEERGLYRND